ncbi:uncharacterized protein LOC117144599 [Drosophila mauritiana]|uniref:Uncharacterized protein LOC117144599 n=1 Tax=Drosophila mauritiana TaxID=7226 RepID=A0A6P8KR40_DROMA|nr:uncharacterized protein LOC117144599 [Drosophila mauritiana]
MDNANERMQRELDSLLMESRQALNVYYLSQLTNNSERMMGRVNSSLDALNTALDNLEARTDRVMVEFQRMIRPQMPAQGPQDGCGDSNTRS